MYYDFIVDYVELTFPYIIYLVLFFMVVRFKRRTRKYKALCILYNGVINDLNCGFYLWDSINRTERFSPCLGMEQIIFYSFDKFVYNFQEPNLLKQNIMRSKNIASKYEIYITSIRKNIRYKCTGSSILDKHENIIGAIMFIELDSNKSSASSLNISNVVDELKIRNTILNNSPYFVWHVKDGKCAYKNKLCNQLLYNNNSVFSKLLSINNSEVKKIENTQHLVIKNERRLFRITKIKDSCNGFYGFGHDITNEDLFQKQATESNDMMTKIIHNISVGISIYAPDSRLITYNVSFMNLWSLERDFLDTKPGYIEVMDSLVSSGNINIYQGLNDFTATTTSHIINLVDGSIVNMIAIPCKTGDTMFLYEKIIKSNNSLF